MGDGWIPWAALAIALPALNVRRLRTVFAAPGVITVWLAFVALVVAFTVPLPPLVSGSLVLVALGAAVWESGLILRQEHKRTEDTQHVMGRLETLDGKLAALDHLSRAAKLDLRVQVWEIVDGLRSLVNDYRWPKLTDILQHQQEDPYLQALREETKGLDLAVEYRKRFRIKITAMLAAFEHYNVAVDAELLAVLKTEDIDLRAEIFAC